MIESEKKILEIAKLLANASPKEMFQVFIGAPDCVLKGYKKLLAHILDGRKMNNESFDCGLCSEEKKKETH